MTHEIWEGMTVRGPGGEKLGKIKEIGDGYFLYEKGLLNKEQHRVSFGELIDVRDDDAIVPLPTGEVGTAWSASEEQEIRVPLKEEQLETEKFTREAGRLEVTKRVQVEEKHFTVPVRHEEVHVERVAVRGGDYTPSEGGITEAGFTDETISVPIREEVVVFRKRPVVREELRITKGPAEGEREIREPLRREVAGFRLGHARSFARAAPSSKRTSGDTSSACSSPSRSSAAMCADFRYAL